MASCTVLQLGLSEGASLSFTMHSTIRTVVSQVLLLLLCSTPGPFQQHLPCNLHMLSAACLCRIAQAGD